MSRYTVGTQRGAFGPFEAQIGGTLNPHQTAKSALWLLCTFKKNGGNTQWRVCQGAHTLLLCSWFRVLVHSQVHSGYTVVHSDSSAGEKGRGPPLVSPNEEAMTTSRNALCAYVLRRAQA